MLTKVTTLLISPPSHNYHSRFRNVGLSRLKFRTKDMNNQNIGGTNCRSGETWSQNSRHFTLSLVKDYPFTLILPIMYLEPWIIYYLLMLLIMIVKNSFSLLNYLYQVSFNLERDRRSYLIFSSLVSVLIIFQQLHYTNGPWRHSLDIC